MARLGRGQPFRPQFRPALQAEESSVFAGPAPANVSVAAPMGTVSVSTPGPTAPNAVVAAPVGTPGVTLPGPTPANVAVAAPTGTATSAAIVFGAVANVSVQAYPGTVSVSTPRPPGASIIINPSGAGNSIIGWGGSHAATFIASSSPPAGCPEATAFEWVDDGIAGGGHAIESSPFGLYPVIAGGVYTISAWVYSSAGSVQIGFDWRGSGSGFISSSTQTIAVPANTWTFVTTTQTAVATAWYLIARVGSGVLSSTVWATDIFVTGAPQVAAAAPMGTVGTGAGEAPANVTVAAPMGTVSVNTFGPQVIGASSFDAGNLDGWTSYPAGSIVVASNLWSHSGDYSDLLTGDGSTTTPSTLKTFTFAGGSRVTQGAWLYSPQGLTATLGVDTYTSGGTYITSFSAAFVLTAGVPRYCQFAMNMPANAGQGHFRFIINGTPPITTQLFVDDPLITITPAVSVAAPLGTPAAQPPSLTANVAVAAPMGTVSVTLPGPAPASVSLAAPMGTTSTGASEAPANVSVAAYVGTISVTTPGPAAANVTVAAPVGLAHYIPPVIVAGPAAASVHVAAPTGGAGGGATSPPAGVAVQAYAGKVSTGAGSPPANVAVHAPMGSPGSSVAGSTAHVTAAAPAGHVTTSVTAPTAGVSAAAPGGHISTSVAGHAATVAAAAPAGTVRITLPGPVSGVSVGAQPGSVGVSATASASCTVAAPRGFVGTSVAGQPASIFIAAPVSPLVAGLYLVTAGATMEFSAGGVKQRRVWFGYGATNVMNTTTPPPKG